jgi:uncharacterized membrane protein YhaH (DUF805 family)
MARLLELWFSFDERVGRREYFWSGVFLMALKLIVDDALVWYVTGRSWSPIQYVTPLLSTRLAAMDNRIAPAPAWLLVVMGVWALPFLWIGVSMTLRRAIDAGLSPWCVLLFFLPVVNWGLMVALAVWPPGATRGDALDEALVEGRLRAAFKGIAAGVAIGAISVGLHVLLFHRYSAAVFLGTPFTMGAAAGWFYNRSQLQSTAATARLGALTIAVAALGCLVFALEGAFCLAMALPLALPVGAFGAVIGRAIRGEHLVSKPALLCLIALPASVVLDRPRAPPLREVATSVEIDAPPDRVWPHVVSFAELAPPPEWFFRLGIAYPMRARIHGTGPGAIRTCEFSTGPFVEPITAWEPPRRLAFDVKSQPRPMHEWSPYRDLHPPHLDGTMRSRRGEFRLVALPGGRTRLEGSTWYELQLDPQPYWSIWSDMLIHQIHTRVLRHIKSEVESRG